MKGAVECVLDACPEYANDEEKRSQLLKNMEALASQGLRVLAVGFRLTPPFPKIATKSKKISISSVSSGLYDPPRR